jgi:adenylate kinase
MIELVCGLSKSGKTTLIHHSNLGELGVSHVRASTLLASRARPTVGLGAADVYTNQTLLVQNLLDKVNSLDRVVLDGHLLLETADGPQLVPKKSLDSLPIAGVLFVRTNLEVLASRRSANQLEAGINYLRFLSKFEEDYARFFADWRSVPFASIDSTDMIGFRASIMTHLRI